MDLSSPWRGTRWDSPGDNGDEHRKRLGKREWGDLRGCQKCRVGRTDRTGQTDGQGYKC